MNNKTRNGWSFWLFLFLLWVAIGFIVENITPDNVDGLGGFLATLTVIVILVVRFRGKNKANREYKRKSNKASALYLATHMHGLPHSEKDDKAEIYLLEDRLKISCTNKRYEMPHDRIVVAKYLDSTDVLKQDKSVVGRGVAGYVLLGPLGSIVGGMSGIGEKKTKGNFLVLNYKRKNTDDVEIFIFNFKNDSDPKKIANFLTEKIYSANSIDGTIEL